MFFEVPCRADFSPPIFSDLLMFLSFFDYDAGCKRAGWFTLDNVCQGL